MILLLYIIQFFAVAFCSNNYQTLRYLEEFGYLPKMKGASAMLSETVFEEAIRELQNYGNIPVTGKVDAATMELMTRKRCGLSDRQKFVRRRRHRKRYALMGTKWDKSQITYSVENPSRRIPDIGAVRREVIEAINEWQRAASLRFTEVRPEANADIKVQFAVGHHGDGYPFDGTNRILAHAFPPGEGIGGDVHLDDDESWTPELTGDPQSNQVSLRSVVMHELGHSLGLSHSQHEDSIMYSFYQYDLPPSLSYDDIIAVQSIYGRGNAEVPWMPPSSPRTTTPLPPLPTRPYYPATTDSVPRYVTTVTSSPDPCQSDFDAVTTIRGEIFVFKDDWFWRIQSDGSLSERPRQINEFWSELPSPIDAVVESDDRIHFFVGKEYYTYYGHRKESVRPLTDLGLPEYVKKIRLVYSWNYWTERPVYLWTEDEFWRVDKKSGKVEIGYPRKIKTTWHNVPEYATAAVTYKNDLYFFAGSDALKFHSFNMTASVPFPSHQLWRYCPNSFMISSNCCSMLYSSISILFIFILTFSSFLFSF